MLETPQKEGEPKIFKLDYPNNAPWEYQGVVYNYYFAEESNNPKAVLVHLHGLNSHGGASGYFGVNLAKTCGINVYALDFKNFGQSGGDERGYIESFEDTVKTAEEFIKFIFNKYKGKPRLFLSGNSFGGSIAVQLAINTPKIYRGLVLFVPAIREVRESQYFMKKLGLAMGYMFPKLKLLNQSFDSGTKFKIGHHILADKNNYTAKIVPGSVRTVLNAMAEL